MLLLNKLVARKGILPFYHAIDMMDPQMLRVVYTVWLALETTNHTG